MVKRRYWLILWSSLLCSIMGMAAPFSYENITPNDFEGTDTERIQKAVTKAAQTTGKVTIGRNNDRGSFEWIIDEAILLPGDITVLLENCTLQLSDQSRDNMFRSDNVGAGIEAPEWSQNIHILGMGRVLLKGADHPRATGDSGRQLTLDPAAERADGNWRVSYGSDAGKPDQKQTGDWRNIMILIAQVNHFSLKNVRIENSHAWAMSFERTRNAVLSDIEIYNPEEIDIDGRKVSVFNKDGIDLRQGCKNFRINNISGFTADDFIALSSLDTKPDKKPEGGSLNSTMVTPSRWFGPEDDTENIFIENINSSSICRSVAIRASDSASIHHVYIRGLISREEEGVGGRHNAVLIGGKGYGKISLPGKINHIYVTDVVATGYEAIMIEAPVSDCHFMNILYSGHKEEVVDYAMDRSEMSNVTETNLVKTNK